MNQETKRLLRKIRLNAFLPPIGSNQFIFPINSKVSDEITTKGRILIKQVCDKYNIKDYKSPFFF